MKNKKTLLLAVAMLGSISLLVGCGNKDKDIDKIPEGETVQQQVEEIKVENPDELKIEISAEAEKISKDVVFENISVNLEGGLTKVTGTVVNNTNKIITPYMNLNFVDESGNKIITANAFADKVEVNGRKNFQAKLTGNFAKYKVEVELADIE